MALISKDKMYESALDMITKEIKYFLHKDELNHKSFLTPTFEKLTLSKAKEILQTKREKLNITSAIIQKITSKKTNKHKILIHTNTYSPYFDKKKYFNIALKLITYNICKDYNFSQTQTTLYIKNGIFSKKLTPNNGDCKKAFKLYKKLEKRFDINFKNTISANDKYPYLKIDQKIKLTNDYMTKNIFNTIKDAYINRPYIIIKDDDNRALIFKNKKLLRVLNLKVKDIILHRNFFIYDDKLYFVNRGLYLLDLKNLQLSSAFYYAKNLYNPFVLNNKLYATYTKKIPNNLSFGYNNYLLEYDLDLNLTKMYSCNRSLKNSYYDKNFFIYINMKLYKYDKNFNLLTSTYTKELTYTFSKIYRYENDLYLLKDTADGNLSKAIENLSLKTINQKELKIKKITTNNDTVEFYKNKLTLKTTKYTKTFLLHQDIDSPKATTSKSFFLFWQYNSLYIVDKDTLYTILVEISNQDKIYDIKEYKENFIAILTSAKIFYFDLKKKKIVKEITR